MASVWRLLDTGVRSAAQNMCLDRAILIAKARDEAPDTFRFLQFSPPAAMVGFHQSVEQEIRRSFCERNGIDINRRITGGGAILFDESSLGWEVISKLDGGPRDILGLYDKMCKGAIKGLKRLAVDAKFRPVNDIEVRGRKISGTGGTEAEGAFLYQGTLLIDFDIETMLKALRIPTEKLKDKEIGSARERVTSLKQELGKAPALSKVKKAILEGFKEVLGCTFEPGPLTAWEQSYLDEYLPYYESNEWVYKVRRPLDDEKQLYAIHKAPGGIIRVSLLLDQERNVIKYILITGDFFAYPNRAILDLEAALKDCKVRRMPMVVKNFFQEQGSELPGVEPQDFIDTIEAALRKRDLMKLGLSAKEANMVHMVNDALEHREETTVVLLPYCAKWADCSLRYDEDCLECGRCTVGVAYELARMRGMEPITIVNFEHLWKVLSDMKKSGVTSYIGCCCEPFFIKHKDDFERAGMSGMLIDVKETSCYELDLEKEAKLGKFKEQTRLDVGLLEKVLGDRGIVGRSKAKKNALIQAGKETLKDKKMQRRCLYAQEKGLVTKRRGHR
jgi:lipoate-protein ligase A